MILSLYSFRGFTHKKEVLMLCVITVRFFFLITNKDLQFKLLEGKNMFPKYGEKSSPEVLSQVDFQRFASRETWRRAHSNSEPSLQMASKNTS